MWPITAKGRGHCGCLRTPGKGCMETGKTKIRKKNITKP